ncbi:uncharacterized protein TNCV_3799641 [Trichonephila clavipes]|nr:uncharacterized protein TNCV_3799641 [Trichonephila clavipes]
MWTTPELAPPLLTTTPDQREDVSALDRFNVPRCPTRRVFSGTGFELVTREATIRYLYHSATAAKPENQVIYVNAVLVYPLGTWGGYPGARGLDKLDLTRSFGNKFRCDSDKGACRSSAHRALNELKSALCLNIEFQNRAKRANHNNPTPDAAVTALKGAMIRFQKIQAT